MFPITTAHLWLQRMAACAVFCICVFPAVSKATTVLDYLPSILATSSSLAPPPPGAGHEYITSWKGTATCLQCHRKEAEEMFSSVHYQWLGQTPYMTDGPASQGKLDVGVNSYCINITGNWNGCGTCHAGLGARPESIMSENQLKNIDCLVCHQEEYKRKKVNGRFVPDTANMSVSIIQAARTVHKPNRTTCLQCHAKGGGGDNYKRGDLALAHANTSDSSFDVHMANTGADLNCTSCHHVSKHRIAGRGSDLRPTDLDVEMSCTDCHTGKDSRNGHDDPIIGNHVARIACQTCHIPAYARNAIDTAASEATETHRDWLKPHTTASGAIHPTPTLQSNLVPKYRWWDGTSSSYLLFDKVSIDPQTGRIPTSRPNGAVSSGTSKLFPFKYKTALQPMASQTNDLIALDTSVYFGTGDANAATASGLVNMGYSQTSPFTWVETDTFQLITHEVMPAASALACNDCHDNTARMNLESELGYELKGPRSSVCTQCHGMENGDSGYRWIHREHVDGEGFDCSRCHNFTRPERGLR